MAITATRDFFFCIGLCTLGILSVTFWNSKVTERKELKFLSKEEDYTVNSNVDSRKKLSYVNQTSKETSRSRLQPFEEVSKKINAINGSSIRRQKITKRKPTLQLDKDRFPRIMIVGFGKVETKVLFNILKARPDLVGSDLERRYFTKNHSQVIDLYLASFPRPPPGGMVVENNPGIIFDITVPKRMKTTARILNIDVRVLKFVILLEDPIERLKSEYIELGRKRWQKHRENLKPFHEMVMHRGGSGEISESQPIIKRSYYLPYVTRWLESFSTSKICFVDGTNLLKNPFMELKLLEGCLGLKPFFLKTDFDDSGGEYCFKWSSEEEVCIDRPQAKSQAEIAPSVKDALKQYFKPMVGKLFQICARRFAWKNFS